MEIKKKARFITEFFGSQPAVGAEGILQKWVEDKQSEALLSFAEKIKRKGQTALQALEEIMSVFNRDNAGNPILGAWMLRKCLINTGLSLFNAQKDKSHPKKSHIPLALVMVEPHFITMHRTKLLTKPDGVKTFTVSLKDRSFFKAYEHINAGTTFECIITVDEDILAQEHVDLLLKKAGMTGVGAFRERYGKFEWV